jgi:RNA polymerase sigma-70 factor, ECF subfamily
MGVGDRPPDDAELAVRASTGDHAAYAQLVDRHGAVAFRVAYLVAGSATAAEEATQEALVKAYLALGRFRPSFEFRPWLLAIVANEARNQRRSAGRRLFYETRAALQDASGDAVPSPEAAAAAAETRRTLLAAVNELPPGERLVVGLRYFLELSEEETAAVAGIPRGTVKSRLSRALGRLRAAITEEADRHGT